MKTAHVGLIRENRVCIQAGPKSEQTLLKKDMTKEKRPSIKSKKNRLIVETCTVTVGFEFHSLVITLAAHRHESSVAATTSCCYTFNMTVTAEVHRPARPEFNKYVSQRVSDSDLWFWDLAALVLVLGRRTIRFVSVFSSQKKKKKKQISLFPADVNLFL